MTTRFPFAVLVALTCLVVPVSGMAQVADTTTADTTTVPPPADTMTVDTAAADTMAVDTVGADSMAAADSVARKPPEVRAKEQARAAASSWLEAVDAGNFGVSWDSAASHLQNSVTREEWIEQGADARSTLQSLKSRDLEKTTYRESVAQLPGAGPVVTLQYRTEFDEQSVREALVTTKQDTVWRVAGYRVVPYVDSVATDTTGADGRPPAGGSGQRP